MPRTYEQYPERTYSLEEARLQKYAGPDGINCRHQWSKYHELEDNGLTLKCTRCGRFQLLDVPHNPRIPRP